MSAAREREEFTKRLVQKLRERGIDSSSPTQVAQGFNERAPLQRVTAQAVRKWLSGEAIPSQPKVKAIAAWLGVTTDWLRFGESSGPAPAMRQVLPPYRPALSDQEFLRRYRKLSGEHQTALAEIITALSERKSRA
ncbi:MAG TPA: helix-turn-helix domain-containing protein [Burkholderiales bacterium]|nr:helix-turn-helix domain-containing protein [Burkholderiales bacterium]